MARITGRVEISVNGQLLLNKSGAVASGIGLSGEPNYEIAEVMGDTGLHGATETPILAELEVTVTDRDDINLDTFARIQGDGTVRFAAGGGGKVYTMNGVYCRRNFGLTAGEGETTLRFFGNNWIESVEAAG